MIITNSAHSSGLLQAIMENRKLNSGYSIVKSFKI